MKKMLGMVLGGAVLGSSLFAQVEEQKNINLEIAHKIAFEILNESKKENVNVSVVVLDRGGFPVLSVKGDNAGIHTLDTAEKKAFTSLAFKIPTTEFASRVENVPSLLQIENTTTLGGGLPIKVGDEIIGAVGVGGAPSGVLDEKLGMVGIEKAKSLLK
ncbi:GlcG/HbpS family heme-binding protein [Fusobacterium necrogenes]|uniref:GlcG/HbpS family heme-binding protein n=1 Tax=Fusobacterium necrogenes TaxID=858 RepID=UPI00255CFC9C|nr:heme-binding protein [Fusobacterium necrogenes]